MKLIKYFTVILGTLLNVASYASNDITVIECNGCSASIMKVRVAQSFRAKNYTDGSAIVINNNINSIHKFTVDYNPNNSMQSGYGNNSQDNWQVLSATQSADGIEPKLSSAYISFRNSIKTGFTNHSTNEVILPNNFLFKSALQFYANQREFQNTLGEYFTQKFNKQLGIEQSAFENFRYHLEASVFIDNSKIKVELLRAFKNYHAFDVNAVFSDDSRLKVTAEKSFNGNTLTITAKVKPVVQLADGQYVPAHSGSSLWNGFRTNISDNMPYWLEYLLFHRISFPTPSASPQCPSIMVCTVNEDYTPGQNGVTSQYSCEFSGSDCN